MARFKDLEGLLFEATKGSRPTAAAIPHTPKPEVRLGFDADRFRWLFKKDLLGIVEFVEKQAFPSLQEWRDIIDQEILRENAEHSKASKTNNESP